MALLPQLLEEDAERINTALVDLLRQTEASLAIVTDKAGFRLAEAGEARSIDTTSLASLAAGSFLATQAIARLLNEPNFTSVYQQGQLWSMLVTDVDDSTVLILIFPAHLSVGLMKYFAAAAIQAIAQQMERARGRAPGSIDPAMLNLTRPEDLFRRKSD